MATFPVLNLIRARKHYKARKIGQTDYKRLYRFEESNVLWLAHHFMGESYETRGGALTPKQKMQTFLRYVADPGFQTSVGEVVGGDQTTVCKVVQVVQNRIVAKANEWIKFPKNALEIFTAKQEWAEKNKIPLVIGAIDCTHVRIYKPKQDGDEFINRKGYPSYNVQATCNSKEIFTSVSAEWPGSVHDSRVFKNSDIGEFLKHRTQNVLLIGDSGYGIAPWIITPFTNPVTETDIYFNKLYAKERVVIERCFGQLKRRFPILNYKIRISQKNISGMIVACFVLHNIAKYLNDPDDFENCDINTDPANEEHGVIIPETEYSDNRTRLLGMQQRRQIADALFAAK